MQHRNKIIFISLLITAAFAIVLFWGAVKLGPGLIVEKLSQAYPGLVVEKVEWQFFTKFKLTNVSYAAERFTFTSDITVKINPLNGVSQVVLEQPHLQLRSQQQLSWERVQQLIWNEKFLSQIPKAVIQVVDGQVDFTFRSHDWSLPVDGTIHLGSDTYLDLMVGDFHFDQIIVFKEQLPAFGSGSWQYKQIAAGQLAWHIENNQGFVLDYFKAGAAGETGEFDLWISDGYVRGWLPDFTAASGTLKSFQPAVGGVAAQILAGGRTPRLSGTADGFKLTWEQNGRWQEAVALLDSEGISIKLHLSGISLQLEELPLDNVLVDAEVVVSSGWEQFVQQLHADGTLIIHHADYRGVDLNGRIEFEYGNKQVAGRASLQILGGVVDFTGGYEFGTKTADGKLEAAGLDLSLLPLDDYQLVGRADFSGYISADGRTLLGILELENAGIDQFRIAAASSRLRAGLDQIQLIDAALHGIETEQTNGGEPITGFLNLTFKRDQIWIQNLELMNADGRLKAQGTFASDQIEISSEADNFPLQLVGSVFDNFGLDLTGQVDYAINLSGKFDQLNGHGKVQFSEVYCEYGYFPAIDIEVELEDGLIYLKPSTIVKAGAELIVEGTVQGFDEPQFDLQLTVPYSYAEDLYGFVEADLQIAGTLKKPQIDGRLALSEVEYPVPYLEQLRAGGVELLFNHDKITVLGSGYLGSSGSIDLNGIIDIFNPDTHLDMKITNAHVFHPIVQGAVDGYLHLTANAGLFYAPIQALQGVKLEGNLNLNRAKVYLSGLAHNQTAGERIPLPEVDLDIDFASREFEILGPGIHVLADGKLTIAGTSLKPVLQADINAVDGTANVLGTSFAITSGRFQAADWRSRPWLAVAGTAVINDLEVILGVEGEINELNWTISSNPALPQHEILSQLNWLRLLDSFSTAGLTADQIWSLIQEQANKVFAKMEHAIQKYFLLDSVQIDPDLFKRNLYITLGKYIRPNVYLSYQRSFFAAEITENLDIEYRFSGEQFPAGLTLKAGVDNQANRRFGLELKRRF